MKPLTAEGEARKLIEQQVQALQRFSDALTQEFEQAVNHCYNANQVIVSGVGKSGHIARKIAASMVSTGTQAVFLDPVEALHGDIGIVSNNNCAVLLSKSGSTEELLRIVPALKQRRTKIVAIVGNTRSPLAIAADAVIDASVEREACPLNLAPMTSTVVALAAGDALTASLMTRRNFTAEDFARSHPMGQLGRNLTIHVSEVMKSVETLPVVQPEVSVREAIIAITSGSVGCVCVVNSVNELVGIITDGDVRRMLQEDRDINTLYASDIMTPDPVRVRDDVLIGTALSLMEHRDSQISVLPVVNIGGNLVGIVRVHDLVSVGI